MCGIVGVRSGQRVVSSLMEKRLQGMVATMHHRGPDASGVWTDGTVGLGHARLAIIDLSVVAGQPMSDDKEEVWLTFNGEIYNFHELRVELEGLGHRFRSRSDTEVILCGYKQWGDDVLQRLQGMFAFGLWDSRKRRLLLARDRIGKKPLYYCWAGDTFLFASETKAILTWPGVPRTANILAIHDYLTYQYVPSPFTAFSGIECLRPAHSMAIDADGNSRAQRYWSLPAPKVARPRPISELKEELRAHLDRSVKLRLVSDVPLGAFLSGGVDSAAVVATMARVSNSTVKTFTVGFEEADYDERMYARMVADRYETDHHEFVLKPDAVGVLPKLIWHYGQPFADPSAIPTYYLAELTRRYVTVALNGDGGDESFLGYHRYLECLNNREYRLPGGISQLLTSFAKAFSSNRRIRRALDSVQARYAESDVERYAPFLVYFNDADKELGYGEALLPLLPDSALNLLTPFFEESPSMLAGAAWADIHTYLPDDLLVKVDIASMAHSLEARSPLLDHMLMEWAACIPTEQKIWGRESKALLKSAMEPYLPKELLYRPKMGFGVPIDQWLRTDLKEMVYDTLLSTRATARGLFKPQYVQMLLDEHCQRVRQHHTRIWALLMLELWYQMWIDPCQETLH